MTHPDHDAARAAYDEAAKIADEVGKTEASNAIGAPDRASIINYMRGETIANRIAAEIRKAAERAALADPSVRKETLHTADPSPASRPEGTFACPICGQDTPHQHTLDEIEAHAKKRTAILASVHHHPDNDLSSPESQEAIASVIVAARQRMKASASRPEGAGVAKPCADPIGCTAPCHDDDGVRYCDVCGRFEGTRRRGQTPSMVAAYDATHPKGVAPVVGGVTDGIIRKAALAFARDMHGRDVVEPREAYLAAMYVALEAVWPTNHPSDTAQDNKGGGLG